MENQEDKLKREILQEAEKRAEKIISRARVEGEQALTKARKENDAYRDAVLADAKAEAVKQCRKLELDFDYDNQRNWLIARENCIDDMFAEIVAKAEALTGKEREKSYAALVREAVENLTAEEIAVEVMPADASWVTPEWLASVCDRSKFSVRSNAAMRPGLIFSDQDGRVTFDNTYATRMRLKREEFRKLLAGWEEFAH